MNDYIFYSDNDEIPNLELFNPKKNKKKIIIFEQKLFYYKFNLLCDRINWYGTRAIKKKNLILSVYSVIVLGYNKLFK